LGYICGGFFFQGFKLKTLILASAVLVVAIFYDNLRVSVYKILKGTGRGSNKKSYGPVKTRP
jgi:hypothetical protein